MHVLVRIADSLCQMTGWTLYQWLSLALTLGGWVDRLWARPTPSAPKERHDDPPVGSV